MEIGPFNMTSNASKLSIGALIELRKAIVMGANLYVRDLEIYCSQVLFRSDLRSKIHETMILASIGTDAIPMIVFLENNPIGFKWFLGDSKMVTTRWWGTPHEIVYNIPKIHGFLNNGILENQHVLVRLERPSLLPIPANELDPLYSWYVGFIVKNIF